MIDCIFCKIVKNEIPSTVVYEDDKTIAFKDINPEAPVHILIVPKEHLASLEDVTEQNADILKNILLTAKKVAETMKISDSGYRVINNCGENGGQTVNHLHFHLIGGTKLPVKILG